MGRKIKIFLIGIIELTHSINCYLYSGMNSKYLFFFKLGNGKAVGFAGFSEIKCHDK